MRLSHAFWVTFGAFVYETICSLILIALGIWEPATPIAISMAMGVALFALGSFFVGLSTTLESKYRIILLLTGLALTIDTLIPVGLMPPAAIGLVMPALGIKILAVLVFGFALTTRGIYRFFILFGLLMMFLQSVHQAVRYFGIAVLVSVVPALITLGLVGVLVFFTRVGTQISPALRPK